MNLFLNVKLPNDATWSKVTEDVARRGLRAREMSRNGELEKRLDINGPMSELPRPRAASESDQPMQVSVPAGRPIPSWTGRRNSSTE